MCWASNTVPSVDGRGRVTKGLLSTTSETQKDINRDSRKRETMATGTFAGSAPAFPHRLQSVPLGGDPSL